MVSTRVATEAMNYVETIADLAYLILNETNDPNARSRAAQIEEHTLALGRFLRSVTRDLKESGL